jgi:hypothetical protein
VHSRFATLATDVFDYVWGMARATDQQNRRGASEGSWMVQQGAHSCEVVCAHAC